MSRPAPPPLVRCAFCRHYLVTRRCDNPKGLHHGVGVSAPTMPIRCAGFDIDPRFTTKAG
jgi:hypothetical protein